MRPLSGFARRTRAARAPKEEPAKEEATEYEAALDNGFTRSASRDLHFVYLLGEAIECLRVDQVPAAALP